MNGSLNIYDFFLLSFTTITTYYHVPNMCKILFVAVLRGISQKQFCFQKPIISPLGLIMINANNKGKKNLSFYSCQEFVA